jgi:hypothetical protein
MFTDYSEKCRSRYSLTIPGMGCPPALRYPARMDIFKILKELQEEHRSIEEAIDTLERLAAGRAKRRGRPPAWMSALKAEDRPKRRGRPPGSRKRANGGSRELQDDSNRNNLLRPFLPAALTPSRNLFSTST